MRGPAVVALSLFTWLSVPAAAQTVRVKWERATDFSQYKTYAWMEGTAPDVPDATDRIIVDYINSQLGINEIFQDDFEPDLYVTYHGAREENFEVVEGYRTDWTDSGAITVDTHVAGTLVVDLVDADDNQLVWRATATATINNDSKKNRRIVEEALRKMFASFPPAPRRNR